MRMIQIGNLINNIDRFILNLFFYKKRIFYVPISMCIDEFGNSFKLEKKHFLIEILKINKSSDRLKFLKSYYNKNVIKSAQQVLNEYKNSKFLDCFFLPWEHDRVRKLSKFKNSHKIGPCPDDLILKQIESRLLDIFYKIKRKGFHPFLFNSYPRVIEVKLNNSSKYIIRDGNHRIASLSYLRYKSIPVCYEREYWNNSKLLKKVKKFFLKETTNHKTPKVFSLKDSKHCPHVKAGNISEANARKLFKYYYYNDI